MNEFFLVALPGLEDVILNEVKDWFPELEATAIHGGVTVKAPLKTGLAMNLCLKTPTRILLRISTFRCRDFPKLFQSIAKTPWKTWLDLSCEMKVHASTRLSRLKIKARIEETCMDGWLEYKEKNRKTTVRGKEQNLYVRFLNDECSLSLDTSGERLHKRGERQNIGTAPLRETIAAAMIQMAGRNDSDAKSVELIDPMMGSGTFLLEAAGRDQLVEKREFAFDNFTEQPEENLSLKAERPKFSKLIGFEADKKTMQAARANLDKGHVQLPTELYAADFFKADPLPAAESRRWLLVNPPYGERIKVKEPLKEYYEELFLACERVAKPDLAYFLLPSKVVKGKFNLPLQWKVIEKRPFVNGGIPVVAFGFGRK